MNRNASALLLLLCIFSADAVEVPLENLDCKEPIGETSDEMPEYRDMSPSLYEVRRTFDELDFFQVVVPSKINGVQLSSVSVTYRNEGAVEWSAELRGEKLGLQFESANFAIKPSLVKNIEFTANYTNYLECGNIQLIHGVFVYRLNHITRRST